MNGSEKEGVSSVSKHVIGAVVRSWLFLIVTMALSALIFHIFTIPMEFAPWVVGTLTYLAAFLAGYRSIKRTQRKGMVKGFWAGVLFVLGYLLVELIAGKPLRLLNSLILLILSMIGGIFGINKKTKRRR